MDEKERDPMPGKQSGQEGRNAPEPGTMPEEYIEENAGNRFSPPPPPKDTEEDAPPRDDLNKGA